MTTAEVINKNKLSVNPRAASADTMGKIGGAKKRKYVPLEDAAMLGRGGGGRSLAVGAATPGFVAADNNNDRRPGVASSETVENINISNSPDVAVHGTRLPIRSWTYLHDNFNWIDLVISLPARTTKRDVNLHWLEDQVGLELTVQWPPYLWEPGLFRHQSFHAVNSVASSSAENLLSSGSSSSSQPPPDAPSQTLFFEESVTMARVDAVRIAHEDRLADMVRPSTKYIILFPDGFHGDHRHFFHFFDCEHTMPNSDLLCYERLILRIKSIEEVVAPSNVIKLG